MAFPTITLSGTDMLADYVGIAYHNLGGVVINFYADSVLITSYTPVDGSPFMFLLVNEGESPLEADEYELEFETNEDARIGVLNVGQMLITQRPCKYVGHNPIDYAKTAQITPVMAMNGQVLGGRVIKTGNANTIEIDNLKADWVRTYLLPFIEHAISRPYFFAWRIDDYPEEVGYGWTYDPIQVSNILSNGMMGTTWEFEGVADSDITQIQDLTS